MPEGLSFQSQAEGTHPGPSADGSGGGTPFPAQNYVSGNRFVAFGAFIEFSQQAGASLFYQYFDGRRNTLQDRDNLQLGFTWEF
jgi:hypothetical protein